jgi:hypothetical protein
VTTVLIVSRTRMGHNVCIGGLATETLENLRLLPNSGEHSHPPSAPFRVGQLWDMDLRRPSSVEPPHVEDVLVDAARPAGLQQDLAGWLRPRVQAWEGDASVLFDGRLRVSSGNTAYVSRWSIPRSSVGFWRPVFNLTANDEGPVRYRARLHDRDITIAYVGESGPDRTIPRGELVRVSLARWFPPANPDFQGCWLQVSGWYPTRSGG